MKVGEKTGSKRQKPGVNNFLKFPSGHKHIKWLQILIIFGICAGN